jgi:hypothetical protein
MPTSRPALRSLAAISIAVGITCLALFRPWEWVGLDYSRMLAAGETWRSGGDPYRIYGYLYTPAMTAVASVIPAGSWSVWAAIELLLVVAVAPRNAWALLVAVTWPGVWADMALGNVTIAMVAATVVAVRYDRQAAGLGLGVALALVPKPMFVLVLLWMLRHRRRSAVGVALGGGLTTLAGLAAAGPEAYRSFAATLVSGVDPHFVGNAGLSYISPLLGAAAFVLAGALAVGLSRRPADGLMAAALAGTFAGTYVGLYSTVLPLALLPAYGRVRPLRATVVAASGLLAPFTLFVAGGLGLLAVAPNAVRARLPSDVAWRRRLTDAPVQAGAADTVLA